MSTEKRIEYHKRDLLLSDDISEGSVGSIIKDIFEINADDDEKEEIYKGFERKPIRFFINSFGGSVYDGLALVDVIRHSKTPVHTICVGSCMSMAFWIWLSGATRLIGESATLMFHDIFLFTFGKTEEVKQDLDEAVRLQNMLVSEIVVKSVIKEETLRDYIIRKAEWYIPAKEALDLKLADRYYK